MCVCHLVATGGVEHTHTHTQRGVFSLSYLEFTTMLTAAKYLQLRDKLSARTSHTSNKRNLYDARVASHNPRLIWFTSLAFSHSSHYIKDFLLIVFLWSQQLPPSWVYKCKQWCCFHVYSCLLYPVFLLGWLYRSVCGFKKCCFVPCPLWPRCRHWSRKGRRWWDRLGVPSSPASPTSAFLQVSQEKWPELDRLSRN